MALISRKTKGLVSQSYMEFFAVGVISALINLVSLNGTSNLVFDSLSFLCSFLFITSALIFKGYISYKISDAYIKAEGDEEKIRR